MGGSRAAAQLRLPCSCRKDAAGETDGIVCGLGPCWPMLTLTYVLVVGISGAIFTATFKMVAPEPRGARELACGCHGVYR
jgi:hypothetical protein